MNFIIKENCTDYYTITVEKNGLQKSIKMFHFNK